jgi:alkaline phosphatase D
MLLSAQTDITKVAVLGCHREKNPAPALKKYIDHKPDVCLWIGDNVYGDTKEIGIAALKDSYSVLEANPDFRSLRGSFPYMATWDDHDFGKNDGGKTYPLRDESRKAFIDFWALEKEIPSERDGIYYAKTFKEHGHILQVIMLDVRYNRDDIGSNGEVLGEKQWKWLQEQLRTKADLRLIVSGFQILLDKESGSETWDNFKNEQKRLFETIKSTKANGVLFLTGDQHYGEVGRMRGGIGYDAIELQFSGINQTEGPEFNSCRVSTVATSLHSCAFIEIHWDKSESDVPHVLFKVIDADTDATELTYRVNLAELSFTIQ